MQIQWGQNNLLVAKGTLELLRPCLERNLHILLRTRRKSFVHHEEQRCIHLSCLNAHLHPYKILRNSIGGDCLKKNATAPQQILRILRTNMLQSINYYKNHLKYTIAFNQQSTQKPNLHLEVQDALDKQVHSKHSSQGLG